MNATQNPPINGSRQRKSLASQLDRLDTMLDGLDQGLAGAITDAVKEAVATTVTETIRATLMEIATNPSVIALFRDAVAPHVPQTDASAAPAPVTEERPGFFRRLARGVASTCRAAVDKVKAVGKAVATRTREISESVVSGYRQFNTMFQLRWPVIIALMVGAAAGMVAYASSPWLAGIVSGIGAAGATLGAQLALWTRRLFAGLTAHC